MPTTNGHTPDAAAAGWFDRISVHGALVAVDMEQRVVLCSDRTNQIFACPEDIIGRRCYEVMTSLDSRNADLCRPNCAVVVAARRGLAFPDFDVWAGDGGGDVASEVSILLRDGDGEDDRIALHYLRRPSTTSSRAGQAPGHVCAALGVLAGEAGPGATAQASLTSRQRHVLTRLAAGLSPAEIAEELELQPVTVRNHLQAAMERLGARTRLEAVLTAARSGLL